MSWQDKRAVTRIFNTFKRLKNGIYNEDVEALKHVSDSLDASQKAFVNDNLLYAKLLCVILRMDLEYYGNMKMAVKNVSHALRMPISYHIQMLEMSLNNNEKINFFKSIGVDMEGYKDQPEVLKENEQAILEKLKTAWEYPVVEKSFYNTANDLLKVTEHYV